MLYSDIQKRPLTSNHKQYNYFRNENSQLLTYFTKYPILPKKFDMRFEGKWDFKAFWLHKISYFVEPKLRIYAYLLIPKKAKQKNPGILALHQHNDEYKAGKSEVVGLVKNPEYMKVEAVIPNLKHINPEVRNQFAYGKELCDEGFIVLAPDFISFEEYRDPDKSPDESWYVREYEEAISQKYLSRGCCLMMKHLHDAYVGLSILSSIKDVDPKRIGVIGHSLGGEVTTVLSAFDIRVKAAVSSCGTLCYEEFENRNFMETPETVIPGFRESSHDFDFFLDLIPPTKFMATASSHDKTITGSNLLLKKRKNFEVVTFTGGHSFPLKVRKTAYEFLKQNLA